MFDRIPTYDAFRPLLLQTPRIGAPGGAEDVWALQKAMQALGHSVTSFDGIFGPETERIVRETQTALGLTSDGKAGPITQTTMALTIAQALYTLMGLPVEAAKGQIEHESSNRLGRYSPPRPDGTYDAGIVQRNTEHTPAIEGFDPHPSIKDLAERTRKHYDLFAGVTPRRRRMALAQGAWNAPAFACYLAREEGATRVTLGMTRRPSFAQRVAFEQYVSDVSKYLPN